ncbi:hypothetical protein [uncultured Paraglaciecola sp.]|uniref:WD40/YVTN/BNR-like repeat-containing protein n=1 Tax=uncultured Paraglaciecola sp. TaxID=1765024 RepID=UPI0030D81597|tara:strand:- start:48184 stop:49197 length:1014 start_codon:yes stop_codon:yes gene_type:complete
MIKSLSLLLSTILSFTAFAGVVQVVDPNVSFQAVHRIGQHIVASGTNGGIYQSTDNGEHWSKVTGPENSLDLQFRDIQLLSNGGLTVMSAGEGNASRIYRTVDGTNWQLQIAGKQPATFYDCMHFIDDKLGWLYGDSDEQGLFILATEDGGNHWTRQSLALEAQKGEGGFASSGTCLNKGSDNNIYIGTGNGVAPRVLLKKGPKWQSLDTPFMGGEAAGVFSVQQSEQWLFIFGGSLKEQQSSAKAQRYHLQKKQWYALPEVPLKGAVYGSDTMLKDKKITLLIANPEGVGLWQEGSASWTMLSNQNIWSIACDDSLGCVGVGKNGVVEQFTFQGNQ